VPGSLVGDLPTMSTPAAIALFLVSLAVTLVAAGYFGDRLDHVCLRLGWPEAIVGLLTALAADAPELASAVAALVQGKKDVSLGVVLGSNAFNLAAMLGVSALVAGAVSIGRGPLLVEGGVGVAATLVSAALVVGLLPAWASLALVVVIIAAYLFLVSSLPSGDLHRQRPLDDGALWKPALLIAVSVALVVAGASGMVRSALVLSNRWNVPAAIVGLVVLAILTSLPNAYTAVRLGRAGRGGALVSETLSSNTINLVGGVIVPALVVGLAARSALVDVDLAWVLVMTVASVALLALPGGLRRGGAALLFVLYLVFAGIQIAFG
jgi:cation:H+ antiporter